MSKDKLAESIQTLKEVFVSLTTISVGEVGKFAFTIEDGVDANTETVRGKFRTGKENYSVTLKGAAGIILISETEVRGIKPAALTSDDLYRSKKFMSLRKYVQDADQLPNVGSMEFKCVKNVPVVDSSTGEKILNTRNYIGDRAYYAEIRRISSDAQKDPNGDYAGQYAKAREALVESGLKPTIGDKSDYATRPVFVVV